MKKMCIISSNPDFLGGVSLYTWDTINELKKSKKYDIFWIYGGRSNRNYKKNGITLVEIKIPKIYPFNEIIFNFKVKKFLEKNWFDIINSNAIWGFWLKNYKKKSNQKMVHTYHGSTYYFFKNHFKRNSFIKKISAFFSMKLGILMEKPPWIKADEIICVSEHVKRELEELYGKRRKVTIIHAKTDTKHFRPRNKKLIKEKLGLNLKNWYGLYVGRGGFWTKGLDRVINISKEIYKKDKNYMLLVIGSDQEKVQNILKDKFVVILPPINRENLPYYYNSSDIFFNLSRYEGGDPTLATGEAMASGCFVVCSNDARQEIIKNEVNGLVIRNFDKLAAEKILKVMDDKNKKEKMIKNSINKITKLSQIH
ncbi:MAG: glycosyltransferase family 4 protein [Candidatus Pacearchaeota archaeon]|jgi:glycosyltransferase involved in cell wall biosynthesis